LNEWLPLTGRDAKRFENGSVSFRKFGVKDLTPGFGKNSPTAFSRQALRLGWDSIQLMR
jgi:hypothetical protein